MAATGVVHHIGTFFLFASAILLLITTISAPVIHDIAILKVTLTNQSVLRNTSVTFGTFGHCVLDVAPPQTDQDYCTGRHIGYDPASIMATIDGSGYSTASSDTAKALTRVMVLHPVACGLAFISFLLALGAGFLGSLLAAFVSAITFVVTLVVMATDFVAFGIIKNHVNSDGSGSHAFFSVGMWTVLAAMILLFLATFLVLFSCCSKRMHKNRATKGDYVDGPATTTSRRHFWQRRRY